jgi:hypothetical protein
MIIHYGRKKSRAVLAQFLYISTLLLNLTTSLALADLNSGLFAYYPFNGNARDESGNGHDGIVQGATLTEDRLGNANSAYRFNGVNNYIRVPDFNLDYDNDFTFSLWVNPTDPIHKEILFNRESAYEMEIFEEECTLRECDNDEVIHKNEFGVAVYEDWNWYSMNYTAVANKPYCVTMVYDKGNARILSYINGILTSTDQIGHDREGALNSFLCIAARGNCDGDFFAGVLDEIRVYSRILSQSEIQQVCNATPVANNLNISLTPTGTPPSKSAKPSKATTPTTIQKVIRKAPPPSNGIPPPMPLAPLRKPPSPEQLIKPIPSLATKSINTCVLKPRR